MYIKDPNSNKMYALDSAQGRALRGIREGVQQVVEPEVDQKSLTFNENPFYLSKDELLILASELDLKLSTRMKEGTMVRKINEHIEAGG